jgi:phosphate starvation-inducible PhoH-like protein
VATKRITLRSQEEALLLFGQHDQNLRNLEKQFRVQIFVRDVYPTELGAMALVVRGRTSQVDKTLQAIESMQSRIQNRQEGLPASAIPLGIQAHDSSNAVYTTSTGRLIRPRTENQTTYVEAIRNNDLVIGIGPAGTGKTYLAVACALAALKTGKVARIILTRPVVEAGEKLGFLPGDFYEKVHPYLKPLYDAFYSMVGPEQFRILREEETVEIVPLAYMRGRTLEDAFVILDEGQNTTSSQMKMFLTRLGLGSKAAVTGDITQIDLDNKSISGLIEIQKILKDIEGVVFVRFGEEDVVRHALVKKIIRAFDTWEKDKNER